MLILASGLVSKKVNDMSRRKTHGGKGDDLRPVDKTKFSNNFDKIDWGTRDDKSSKGTDKAGGDKPTRR